MESLIIAAFYGLVFLGAFLRAFEYESSYSAAVLPALFWPVGLGVICADRMLQDDSDD